MKLSKDNEWFTGPWFDSLLLVNISAFIFLFGLAAINSIKPLPITEWSNGWALQLSQKFVLFHFIVTLIVVYSDPNETRNKIVFFLIPAFLVTAFLFFRFYFGLKDQTSTTLYHFIIFHELFQYGYILSIFQFIKKYPLFDSVVNCAALMIGPIYPYVYDSMHSQITFYGQVKQLSLNPVFFDLIKFLSLSAICIFIIRQFDIFRRTRKIRWFPVLMVAMANVLYYVPIMVLKNNSLFILFSFKFHHSFQYAVWLILYCQLKYKSAIREGARLISYLSHPKRVILLILFTISVFLTLIMMVKGLILVTHNGETIDQIFLMTALLLHVYIDMVFFWNIRKISLAVA